MQNPGSYKLWREFLHVIQSGFTTFKVAELRKMYGHAIQALSTASRKRHRQLHTMEPTFPDAVDVDLELGLVDMFLSLCRFEWQAGYRELATALLQAEMEYSLFCPPLQLTEQSKKRLFEHFWNSDGARIGEDGSLGWSTWLEKEEENRRKLQQEMSSKEEEQGGWTGWFVPPEKDAENLTNIENVVVNDVELDEMEDEEEVEDAKQEEDDDALLRMLGIDVDVEANREVHDTRTWARWSKEESSRDSMQWMPVRAKSEASHSNEGIEDEEEQLSRVILFEDITDYLFSLSSTEARLSLVLQFIDFFGGQVSQSICTNSSSWTEKILSLETLPEYILQHLRKVNDAFTKVESGSSVHCLEVLLHHPDSTARMEIMKFLRNATLLCLRVFPRNYKIEEAILIAEEQSYTRTKPSQEATTPSQALAKRLLKSDRQDVLLCGVYARREAAFGNIHHARKVFDMALSSVNGLPLEAQLSAAPLLTLWYSEMELADVSTNESESTFRALHILSCLGSGVSYTQYKGRPSSTQLLRAHQGFKERISKLRLSWQKQVIDESSIALICSAALFEELTAGWVTGVKVLSDALSMVLPERKSRSYQVELLYNYHVRMLQRHHQEAKLSKLLQSVTAGLQIYPCNPELFSSLVELSHLYAVPHNLRRILDEVSKKEPSAIVWLFALSYELSRGGSSHRIHGLFERALANDLVRSSVVLWRSYIAYEIDAGNLSGARRIFFRAIHACPWSKLLWLDGFQKLSNVLSAKELMDLQEVMRDKELNLRTDIYEILLQDELTQN